MRSYTIQLPCIELLAPDDLFHNEDTLKEYALSHWKDEVQRRLIVGIPTETSDSKKLKYDDSSTDNVHSTNITSSNNRDEPTSHVVNSSNSFRPSTISGAPDSEASRLREEQAQDISSGLRVISSPNHSLPKKLDLLNTIARVQRQFFHSESPKVIFGTMLDALLLLLDSEYGFIGEVKYNNDDQSKYLQTHAITNIAWDNATRQFFDENITNGLKFTNLHSLFGKVITTASPVISNDPKSDKRGCGVPPGHPPLDHFLGIPFFMPGGEMNGMVGISNKPGGYCEDDIEFLEPFTVTCGNLINAFNQINQNKYLINTLEDSVKKRTLELENANAELAEANRFVMQANKMQLQHFACMSHEIRTPLNCVIGMASVLGESRLTTIQKEAVDMIVNSGDLLLAIVNDVLDYSKYETEDVNIHIQQNSLQNTITLVLKSILSKAHPTQSIRSHFDPLIPEHISTDTRRLQQILFNLLGNAVKFSPIDGIIKLSIKMISQQCNDNEGADADSASTKSISVDRTEPCDEIRRMLRFVVEDNGKGIDESDLKRIFQPFQQASSNAENVYGGTGLGLSITQKIIAAMGGTISVASKKGEWSKFTVDIPCHDSPVDIEQVSHQVKNYVVHVVGMGEVEKSIAEGILKTFNMNGYFFSRLDDMLKVYQAMKLTTEHTHVLVVHEDCYDHEKAAFLAQSVILTVGQNVSVDESLIACHFRSLEYILPSHFMNRLVEAVSTLNLPNEKIPEVATAITENMMSAYTDMKVLIAEDNVVNQKVLTRILNRLNVIHIDIVENGLEACNRLEKTMYDFVFMDQQMPIMGGVAACRHITSYYNSNDVPNHCRPSIVFATAHVSPDFERECSEAGGSGFVAKPFNLDIIKQCLLTVFEHRLKMERANRLTM